MPDAGENGFCTDRSEVVGDLGPAVGAALFELASQPSSESEDGNGGGDGDGDGGGDGDVDGAPDPVLSPAETAGLAKVDENGYVTCT